MDEEIWKAIEGWEGFYEVSTHGRVRSLDRKIPDKRLGYRRVKGRVLRPSAGTDYMPYHIVTLNRGGKYIMPYVHTLVLETFVGPRPEGNVACHYDGNPANNRLDNLRWDTQEANQQDSMRHGTHVTHQQFRRLSEATKRLIVERKASGQSSLAVAAAIGCCRHTVDRYWRMAQK